MDRNDAGDPNPEASPLVQDPKSRAKSARVALLETPGGGRAVASGMYNMIFSIFGSGMLWVVMVVGSGSEGIAYYGLSGSVLAIITIVSSGFSQAYIALVKEELVRDEAKALEIASVYTRTLATYGLFAGTACIVLGLVLPPPPAPAPPMLNWVLLLGGPQIYVNLCVRSVMAWSLHAVNRYDVAGLVGTISALLHLTLVLTIIIVGWPGYWVAFAGFVSSLVTLPFIWYSFRKHAPFTLTQLFTAAKLRHNPTTKRVLKYSSLTLLSNMETFQLVSNVNFFLTSLALTYFSPATAVQGTALLTILNVYAQVKCAFGFFSSPLNVELAEAFAKEDREQMEETINHSVKFSLLVGFLLVVGFCGLAPLILRYLHGNLFRLPDGAFDQSLFDLSLAVAVVMSLGQGGFGVSSLFANALIGTNNADASARVYLGALLVSIGFTPFCVVVLRQGIMGIAWSTLIVGSLTVALMMRQVKHRLHVHFQFRFTNMLPILGGMFGVLFFFPYGGVTGVLVADVALALLPVVLLVWLGLPFFGVLQDEGDWRLLRDLYTSIGLRKQGEGAVQFARKVRAWNPRYRKTENLPSEGKNPEEAAP